jgi:hypothetical protein
MISPGALGMFFSSEERMGWLPLPRVFCLRTLGLNHHHCKVMAEQLAMDFDLLRPSTEFDFRGNPSIGEEGYEALLGLLNRKFDIRRINVDDQKWKATFFYVAYMNNEFDRGRFLKEGAFPSKTERVDFLAKLTNARFCPYREIEIFNAIWCTLREDPDLIYTHR